MNKMVIEWESSFESGNATVDAQHKKLFELVNAFAAAYMLNKEKEIITQLLFDLQDYTKYHFAEEEKILGKTSGLPSAEHLNQHEYFLNYIYDLKFEYVSDDKAVGNDLLMFLINWLKEHILGVDKKELAIKN